MIQAITQTNLTTYLQTEDNRIDTSVASTQIRHLLKFTNDSDKSVQYAYGATETIYERYTKFTFDYNTTKNVFLGRINFLPAGYWKYEVYEVSWIGTVSLELDKAPTTEIDVLPVDNDNGVVQGLVTKGKMYVDEKAGTEQVQYIEREAPTATNYIYYGGTPVWENKFSIDFPSVVMPAVGGSVNMGNNAALRLSGDMTISMWINTTSLDAFNGNHLLSVGTAGTAEADNALYYIAVGGSAPSSMQFQIGHEYGAGIFEKQYFNTMASTNTWYHLGLVRDTTAKTYKLYLNGVLGAGATGTFNYTNNPTGGANGELTVGNAKLVTGASRNYYDGFIDEFSLFNTTKTAGEITALYNSGAPADVSSLAGLVGYWRMGDPNGQSSFPTIPDASLNSNDGTMEGALTSTSIVTTVP